MLFYPKSNHLIQGRQKQKYKSIGSKPPKNPATRLIDVDGRRFVGGTMTALHSPLTQLETAGKTLNHRWETTKTAWDDRVSHTFESDYLSIIEAQAQATLKEMQQLAQAIDAARRAVP